MESKRSRRFAASVGIAIVLALAAATAARAQSEGDLDASYGNPAAPGRQVRYFDVGLVGYDIATGVTIDGSGRALAVGVVDTADATFPFALGLVRFTPDGQVDASFGNLAARPGALLLDLASSQELASRSVHVRSDGKIVVAASRVFASVPSSVGIFSRLAADGSAIESTVAFNLPSTPLSLPPRVRGFAVDASGRYLPFGDVLSSGQPMVARLGSGFAIDGSYATGGWTLVDPFEASESGTASVWQLRVDAQGRAVGVISGTISGGDDLATLFRLLPSGAPDPDFGTNGETRVVPDFLFCSIPAVCHWTLRDLVVAPDGAIYAAGWVQPDVIGTPVHYGWLVALSADGDVVDQAGVLPLFAASLDLAALVLDPHGGLVVAGAASSPPSADGGMFAARYDAATLTIDPNFGLGGKQEFDFTGLSGYTLPQAGAFAVALDGGRPFLAGGAVFDTGGSNLDFAVARLWSGWIFVDDFESSGFARWSGTSGAP